MHSTFSKMQGHRNGGEGGGGGGAKTIFTTIIAIMGTIITQQSHVR